MTVSELIAELQKLPQDALVTMRSSSGRRDELYSVYSDDEMEEVVLTADR